MNTDLSIGTDQFCRTTKYLGILILSFALCIWNTASLFAQNQVDTAFIEIDMTDSNHVKLDQQLKQAFLKHVSDPRTSIVLARSALRSAQSLRLVRLEAEAENTLGAAYSTLAIYPAALAHFERSIGLNGITGNERPTASVYTNIGVIHEDIGEFEKAIEDHEKSIAIKEKYDDQRGIGHSYHNLGYAYASMGEFDQALKHFKKGLTIRASLNDTSGIMSSMNRIGDTYAKLARPDTALYILDSCLALAENMGDVRRISSILESKAKIFRILHQPEKALKIASQRAVIELEYEYGTELCKAHILLSEIALDLNDPNEVNIQLRLALHIADSLRILPLKAQILEKMIATERAAGHLLTAFDLMDQYNACRDSLERQSNTKEVAKMFMEQEFHVTQVADSLEHAYVLASVEAERTIEQLRADKNRNRAMGIGLTGLLLIGTGGAWFVADRKRRQERFEKESATLETLALRSQMNPHFIFNALNSINAFVQKNDQDSATSYLSKFARVMRAVLENSRRAEVPLKDDLEALRGYMSLERMRMEKKFDFTITVDPAIDPEEVMVPPLVVQPFVENAIWHGMAGKEGKGQITLNVAKRGSQMVWTIEDDGAGRHAKKANSSEGQAMKKTSLGTAITRSRLDLVQKQHGGKAGFQYTDLVQGTRVEVEMPFLSA